MKVRSNSEIQRALDEAETELAERNRQLVHANATISSLAAEIYGLHGQISVMARTIDGHKINHVLITDVARFHSRRLEAHARRGHIVVDGDL